MTQIDKKTRDELRRENIAAFKSLKSDGTIELYQLLRSYLQHEDNLVHYRTSWFLTLNSFLFAAVALILSADSEKILFTRDEVDGFLLILGLVGFLSAVATLFGIVAAHASTKALKDLWVDKYEPLCIDLDLSFGHRSVHEFDFEDIKKTRFRNDPTRPLPYIKGGGGRFGIAKKGRYLANSMPIIIGGSWLFFIGSFGIW